MGLTNRWIGTAGGLVTSSFGGGDVEDESGQQEEALQLGMAIFPCASPLRPA